MASTIEDFRIDNVRARVAEIGDLWAPLLARRGRFRLAKLHDREGVARRRPDEDESSGSPPAIR